MQNLLTRAGILVEAIPYINTFRRKTFVIKYGGSMLDNENLRKTILDDIIFLQYLGIRIVLVHGGGLHINTRLKESGITPKFKHGLRVTDQVTLPIVQQELHNINSSLVMDILSRNTKVVGLFGEEGRTHAERKNGEVDLGFVGSVTSVTPTAVSEYLRRGYVVVFSPMGRDSKGQIYNINADEVASSLAIALKAQKFILLTNVRGVQRVKNSPKSYIPILSLLEVNKLIENGTISAGMIPKVQSCIAAVEGGVKQAHIIDAHIKHALLLEILTSRGIGTQIRKQHEGN